MTETETRRIETAKRMNAEGAAHFKTGDVEAARAAFSEALLFDPDSPEIWTNLGSVYRATGQFEAALQAQRKAHRFGGGDTLYRNNLANALEDMGQHLEAVDLRKALAEEEPGSSKRTALLVRSLRNAGKLDAAEAVLRAAFAGGHPGPDLRLEHGIHNLALGNYAEGFKHYLARRDAGLVEIPTTDIARWTGQDLRGKTILVLPEQGLGDTVCFARFLPYLKERGARAHLLTRPPLLRLLQGLDGADAVVAQPVQGVSYDYWTSLMDIPVDYFHFRDPIPAGARMSVPDDARRRAAECVDAHRDRLKIGVCWRGAEGYSQNAMRSFPHRLLRDVAAIDGVRLFSLYKGPALEAYLADGTASEILNASGSDRDLADCAALIEEMDLVVTMDTAIAHVAGSLGKEVWNLLHWIPFWLYGYAGATTPWYPSMRLFRQTVPFDWGPVMAEVIQGITQRLSKSGPSRGDEGS